MPTKQTAPFLSNRAAAMVMISLVVYVGRALIWGLLSHTWCCSLSEKTAKTLKIFGVHDMPLNPLLERLALARDSVPGLVEAVVTLVVTVSIGWERATRNAADGGEGPVWQDAGVWPGPQVIHNLFHSDDGFFGGEHRFLLYPENAPEQDVS